MLRQMTRWLNREEAGFTLIELMIVILVILILAAILIPQFGLARERARKASCVSNQRNIETAVAMWATDNPNINYVAGVFNAAGTTPSFSALTGGTTKYTTTANFAEPDHGVTPTGADYYLYDGAANGGTGSAEYGHVTCAWQAVTDPWVDNQNTAGAGTGLDHRRNPNFTP